jgi:hypothetical protein
MLRLQKHLHLEIAVTLFENEVRIWRRDHHGLGWETNPVIIVSRRSSRQKKFKKNREEGKGSINK